MAFCAQAQLTHQMARILGLLFWINQMISNALRTAPGDRSCYVDSGDPVLAWSIDNELADEFLIGDDLVIEAAEAAELEATSINLGDGNRMKSRPRYD